MSKDSSGTDRGGSDGSTTGGRGKGCGTSSGVKNSNGRGAGGKGSAAPGCWPESQGLLWVVAMAMHSLQNNTQ